MSRQTKRSIFTLEPLEGSGEMRTDEPGAGERIAGRIGQTAGQVARDAGSRIGQRLGELGTNAIDALGRRLEGMQFQNPLHIPNAYIPPRQEPGTPAYEVTRDGTLWVNDPTLAQSLVSEVGLAGVQTPGGAFHLGMSVDGQTGTIVKLQLGIEGGDRHEIEPIDPKIVALLVPTRTGPSGRR